MVVAVSSPSLFSPFLSDFNDVDQDTNLLTVKLTESTLTYMKGGRRNFESKSNVLTAKVRFENGNESSCER